MRKNMLFASVTVMLSLLLGQSVFATVDTRLTFVSNTYNSPSSGQGTLVVDVEAKSNDGSSYDIEGFQDAFQLDATLMAQTSDESVSFSDQLFPPSEYTTTEDYNYNYSDGRVRYVYTIELSGSLSTIETSWTQVVRVTIEYTMTGATSTISWYDGNPNFVVMDSTPDLIEGSELAIPSELNDFSLPVELSSFTAIDSAAGVELEWTTQTEVNNIGFYIYRSETKEDEYSRVNKKIINGTGSSAMPHTYKYIDDNVDPDVEAYFYYLEDVDITGIKNKSQIIKVTHRKVSKFTAEYHNSSVSLKWSVEPQLYIPAWNIYQSADENGAYVKLGEPQIEFDDETYTYSYAEPFPNEYFFRHPGEYLYYHVEGMDSEGKLFIKSRTIKVEIIPESFALFQNYPNPYNPETWIPYQLPEDTTVTIKIYGITGHLIRTLSLGEKRMGIYISRNRAAHWNGRNEAGERVSSGLYFYAIEAENFRAIRRMLLVK